MGLKVTFVSFADPKTIFQASLANAQMLIPSSQGGVSSILLEGRTLLALATTVYGPGGIDQVLPGLLTPPDPHPAALSCPLALTDVP